jgi:hypothetical protein
MKRATTEDTVDTEDSIPAVESLSAWPHSKNN